MTQPNALYLAQILQSDGNSVSDAAAKELRSLHAINQELRQSIIKSEIKTDKSEPCRYPDCVDNGPEGKCMRWLLAECSKSEDFKPRREWRGLDAEEIWGMTCECDIDYECAINFGKDIEAALKERNA